MGVKFPSCENVRLLTRSSLRSPHQKRVDITYQASVSIEACDIYGNMVR